MSYQYRRKAHYHETDQMGIVHHANTIKWFEEARVAMLSDMGLPYRSMEAAGVFSPVLSIACQYKAPVKFDDEVLVDVAMSEYTGFRFQVNYTVRNAFDGKIHAFGESTHCFVNSKGRPIRLKKVNPEMHQQLTEMLKTDS